MNNFIVTGGTGFIGSNLIKKLIKLDYKVSLVCRDKSDLSDLDDYKDKIKVYRHNGDINKLISFFKESNASCVFHLASLFIAEHKSENIEDLIYSNLKFSTEIIEATQKSGIKYFINTGTSWQHYENDEYNPVCLYAATKEAFEKIIDYYVKAKGLKAITLKLFDTYGREDKRNKLINNLKEISISKKTLDMSGGEQKIDLTYIDDIIDGYIKSYEYIKVNEKISHEKYALCSGRVVSLKELISIFEKETGYKLNINWGSRAYREREVMNPWSNYEILPNWKSKISIEEGVKEIVK